MNIVVDGKRYTNFLSAKVKAKMGSLTREFEFEAATRGVGDVPFFCGQAVQIFDGEDLLLTGFIERMSIKSSGKGHVYSLSGRDKLGDLIDSNLPRVNNLRGSLPTICKFVLGFLGIEVDVVDEVNSAARPYRTIIAPDPEDTAGEFLTQLARRKRVLLQSDGAANLVITDGIGRDVETRLVNRIDGVGNNMLEASLVIDHSQRFGRYSTELQINMASAGSAGLNTPPDQIIAQRHFTTDPTIRQTRFRTTAADYNLGTDDGLKRPLWEIALNRAEAIKYNVTVPGFRDWKGRLWEVNTAPIVDDQYNGVPGVRMMISSIEYSLDGEGETTRLILTDSDAFKAELKIRKDIEYDGPSAT